MRRAASLETLSPVEGGRRYQYKLSANSRYLAGRDLSADYWLWILIYFILRV